MQSTKGIKKLEAIIEDVKKNGIIAENMIEQLTELREIAKVEKDPLVVKTLRLVYSYIEDEGHLILIYSPKMKSKSLMNRRLLQKLKKK